MGTPSACHPTNPLSQRVCLTVHWMADFLSLGPANLLGIGRGVITFNMKRNAAKMPETCTDDIMSVRGCILAFSPSFLVCVLTAESSVRN